MKIRPKKSLGQNFLIDKNVIKIITELGNLNKNDTVLEVGPGTGNLTENILSKKPKKIIVVEKDHQLSINLREKFGNKIKIINDDILNINENIICNNSMIIYGNLPYNISSQILVKWIKLKNLNSFSKKLILMFQKEVANRIIAKLNCKDYGRLSIFVSWRMKVEKIKDISPKSFYPSPKVDSTVLTLIPKKNYIKFKNPKNLEHVTNIFFNQRRKMIKKPLKLLFKNYEKIIQKLKLNINLRPQNLSPDKYFEICKEYEKLLK